MIEITGLDAMRAKLNRLEEQVRREFVVKAVKAGANVIRDAMIEDAPVLAAKSAGSNALEPGALRDDIKTRAHVDKDGVAVAHIGPSRKTGYVARFVEYGHREVKDNIEIGQVPPHSFLRPAFERSEAEAIETFKSTMREEIAGELS
ncbi:MAG: HK97-gp10 family putative phage morphogenesis protein [Acidobacteriaceae bacterium]